MHMIVPIPKEIVYLNKENKRFLDIASCQTIDYTSFFDERLETLTEIIVDTYYSEKRNGLITFKYQKLGSEAYILSIREKRVVIKAEDKKGCYYALKTLKQLAKKYNGMIPEMTIKDSPDMSFRGFQLDISRSKVASVKTIFELIDLLSDYKYNSLQLYVEGFSFEYQSMPFVNKDKNYISVDEYKQIEKYANDHFIDLIPNQNGFGHMGDWLSLDEFKDLANVEGLFPMWGSNRYPTTLDPTNEKSFELVKKMYDDMLPHSNSKYFNMNFDEPYERVFVEFFNKLALVTKGYNKRPMLWGDVIIHHPEAIKYLDPDAILLDWGYTDDYPFLKNAEMLKKLKRPFIMAPGTSTWAAISSKYEEMLGSIKNAAEGVYHFGGLGILLTDWGDFGHLQYFPFSLPGIIYTSLISWNYKSASEHFIKECLIDLVDDPNEANLIIELSKYYLNEDHYRGYSTKLFNPIVNAELVRTETNQLEVFKKKCFYNLLTEQEYARHKFYLEHLSKKINIGVQDIESVNNTLLHQELENALFLLSIMLDVNQLLKGCRDLKFNNELYLSIDTNLNKYLENHFKLWCARNKEPGYKSSALRIERLKSYLQMLKKEAINYEI